MALRTCYWIIVPVLVVFMGTGTSYAQGTAPEPAFTGRRISAIRYAPETQPYSLALLDQMNPVKAGDVFNIRKIASAIERLYETGRFYTVDVDAALSGEEVILEFRTEPAWFVGKVTVNGLADPPNVSQLISASRLELGQDFTEDYLLQSSQNIIALMRANGMYRATVDPRYDYEP